MKRKYARLWFAMALAASALMAGAAAAHAQLRLAQGAPPAAQAPSEEDKEKAKRKAEDERRKQDRAKADAERAAKQAQDEKQRQDRTRAEEERRKQDRAKADADRRSKQAQDEKERQDRAKAEEERRKQDRAKADAERAAKQAQDEKQRQDRAKAEEERRKQDRAKADAERAAKQAQDEKQRQDRAKADAERAKADALRRSKDDQAKTDAERAKRTLEQKQAEEKAKVEEEQLKKERAKLEQDRARLAREREAAERERAKAGQAKQQQLKQQQERLRAEEQRLKSLEDKLKLRGDRAKAESEEQRRRAEQLHEREKGLKTTDRKLDRLEDIQRQRQQRVEAGGRIVIEEPDRRRIVKDKDRIVIQHDETERFRLVARPSRTERRPDGVSVHYFTRPDGTWIVSEVDDDGRLIRRYRRTPQGRQFILIDNSRTYRRDRPFFEVRINLPPPVIRIPRERYIVEYSSASEDLIYETLLAPPVERLGRSYSLDEIRYSHELRDRMRRIDLDEINFEFGSWEVTPDQLPKLERLARAINRVLSRSPDEVFLIEGYTDAVGSDEDNLTLSDRRAESVAVILSEEFRMPPENLVTQGYGEQFLKVQTEGPERINRRVAFRRITPMLGRGS